jgi:ParB-like chromosome segregation protein Spo0J
MELIDINKIKLKDNSLKKKDALKYQSLYNHIKKYGQLYPIIVTKDMEIVKGRSIYKVCKELGLLEVYINKINVINYDQIYLELSLITQEVDTIKILKGIKNMDEEYILPFSKKEIASFKEILDFNWDQFNTKKRKSFL